MTTSTQIENRKTFHDRLVRHFSKEDVMLIDWAYDMAKEAHRTHKRVKGGRYFEHPRAGCLILMDELGLYDRDLLIIFLLHDTGEDSPLLGSNYQSYQSFLETIRFRLGLNFSETVVHTVIHLTKPFVDESQFFTTQEAYDYYIAMIREDEKAILGKMVDRLHNLRTLPEDNPKWIQKQINETEQVYLPLFSSIKGDLRPYSIVLLEKIKDQISILKAML